jgi:two-component system OmpR family response regulator
MKILVVEDELEIARIIKLSLEAEGFSCIHCQNGLEAIEIVKQLQPDVVILDLMLPGLDGLEVCARIRQQPMGQDPYILMLTAKGEEIDRVIGLSTGADDYLVKPFSPRELVARVRALLRRSLRQSAQQLIYRSPHFLVNVDLHLAYRQEPNGDNQQLDLTTLEFKLMTTFLSHPGRVWRRSQLIENLWEDKFFGDERVVDTHIARLRKKIEPDPVNPTFIKTVSGVGYKFEDVS